MTVTINFLSYPALASVLSHTAANLHTGVAPQYFPNQQ